MGSAAPKLLLDALLLFALAATTPAQAPPGYKTFENKQQPITFYYPTSYSELPLPPTEQALIARYVMKNEPSDWRLKDGVFDVVRPEICVFHFALAAPTTGVRKGEEKPEDDGPANAKEAMEASTRVGSWKEFEQRLGKWTLTPDAKKPGVFRMTTEKSKHPLVPNRIGCLVRKEEGGVLFGVFVVSIEGEEKDIVAQAQKIAGSMKLVDPADDPMAQVQVERLYASGKFRDVEGRKKARAELASGWKALDTEHYLIVHHSKNEALIKRIARDVEAMRSIYLQSFAPRGKVDALSVIRVCRTKDEYHQYGGPPNTGGYWHPGNEELVLYDYSYTMKTLDEDDKKRFDKAKVKLTDDDSLLVLYHEALHQYMHYAVGEFSPHDWFNEGYGDYFSGTVIGDDSGKVQRIDPSPWRIHLAKDMCEKGVGYVPLKSLLNAERAEFYNPQRAGHYYAAAWSFVFFLQHGKAAREHPQWSKLLPTYYETLVETYAKEIEKLGPSPNLEQKTVVGFQTRKAALAKVLDGLDLTALEAAWKTYVIEMKDPWPSKRKKG